MDVITYLILWYWTEMWFPWSVAKSSSSEMVVNTSSIRWHLVDLVLEGTVTTTVLKVLWTLRCGRYCEHYGAEDTVITTVLKVQGSLQTQCSQKVWSHGFPLGVNVCCLLQTRVFCLVTAVASAVYSKERENLIPFKNQFWYGGLVHFLSYFTNEKEDWLSFHTRYIFCLRRLESFEHSWCIVSFLVTPKFYWCKSRDVFSLSLSHW